MFPFGIILLCVFTVVFFGFGLIEGSMPFVMIGIFGMIFSIGLMISDYSTPPDVTEEILKTNLSPAPEKFELDGGDWLIRKITYTSPGIKVFHNKVKYVIIGRYVNSTFDTVMDDVKNASEDVKKKMEELKGAEEIVKQLKEKSK